MSFVILTKNPNIFSKDFIVSWLKVLFKKSRGPQAVLQSLIVGLKELGADFELNLLSINKEDTVLVNDSISALNWAIKNRKNYSKLIAGPNLVISPNDHGKILCDLAIDNILVPSKWVKDFYLSLIPDFKNKIKVWPAGVSLPAESNSEKTDFLIYVKNNNSGILEKVTTELSQRSLPYAILEYGQFDQADYFKKLDKARGLIYISNSESQGLALFEAWARNVPTLVWNRGFFQSGDLYWKDEKISAPFLNDDSGLFFTDEQSFKAGLDVFLGSNNFQPRRYVVDNFTNKKIAENLLKLINETAD